MRFDLTDVEWLIIEPLLPQTRLGGKRPASTEAPFVLRDAPFGRPQHERLCLGPVGWRVPGWAGNCPSPSFALRASEGEPAEALAKRATSPAGEVSRGHCSRAWPWIAADATRPRDDGVGKG